MSDRGAEVSNLRPRVLCGAPVHNREDVLPAYLAMLLPMMQLLGINSDDRKLSLPLGLERDFDVGFVFLLNNCNEATRGVMEKFRDIVGKTVPVRLVTVAGVDSYEGRQDTGRYETLTQVRNMLLDQFSDGWEEPWTHLFSVDTDIIVSPGTLRRLLEDDKDIVSALVYNDLEYRRLTGRSPDPGRRKLNVMKFANQKELKQPNHFCDFPKDLFRCDVTGAVYLMKADVVKKVRYEVDGNGEDVGFCRNAIRAGFEMWSDGRLYCQHIMDADLVRNERGQQDG